MEEKRLMKLCAHCEGRIELDAVSCHFCGRNISDKMTSEDEKVVEDVDAKGQSLSPQETLASLYPPPYRPKVYEDFEDEVEEETEESEEEEETDETEVFQEKEIKKEKGKIPKDFIIIIGCLGVGLNLFLLSLFLIVFSSNGELILQWDAKKWFIYFFVSLPLMVFGWHKLNKIK
jgi:hypothetical protein